MADYTDELRGAADAARAEVAADAADAAYTEVAATAQNPEMAPGEGGGEERPSQPAPYVELDYHAFADAAEVHAFLARELDFPEYYGRNLDALYDCLMDLGTPVTVRIRRRWHQAPWFKAIAYTLRAAEDANPHLTVN